MQTITTRAFGFDIDVQPGFLVLLGIYALFMLQWQVPLWAIVSWCVVVYWSIVIHEVGHAYACTRVNVEVLEVALHGFGGHVRHPVTTPRNQLFISLAGPFAGFMLGIPALVISWFLIPSLGFDTGPIINRVLSDIVWVNVGWGILNLMPMKPLDGGNALQALLSLRLAPRRAAVIACQVGIASGVGVAVLGYVFDFSLIPLIGLYAAYMNYQMLRRAR